MTVELRATTSTDTIDQSELKGYWWQCMGNCSHAEKDFRKVGVGLTLVKFFYNLADKDWNQRLLYPECTICHDNRMQVTYDFPRKANKTRLRLQNVVGLKDGLPGYLPMIWSAVPEHENEEWFDFKYVGKSNDGRHEAYGLARPAVFSKSQLRKLFETYKKVVGCDLLDR